MLTYDEINKTIQASSVGGTKHNVSTEYVLKVLGLDICSDTIVGNDMVRGISGGQRKRVTTGLSHSLYIYFVCVCMYLSLSHTHTHQNNPETITKTHSKMLE